MRCALLGPTPGSRPSSSIRSWTTPSYTSVSLSPGCDRDPSMHRQRRPSETERNLARLLVELANHHAAQYALDHGLTDVSGLFDVLVISADHAVVGDRRRGVRPPPARLLGHGSPRALPRRRGPVQEVGQRTATAHAERTRHTGADAHPGPALDAEAAREGGRGPGGEQAEDERLVVGRRRQRGQR